MIENEYSNSWANAGIEANFISLKKIGFCFLHPGIIN